MDITELVSKRALLRVKTARYGGDAVDEYKILEVSPSGNWAKVQNTNGYKFWKPVTEIAFVEMLTPLRPARPETETLGE